MNYSAANSCLNFFIPLIPCILFLQSCVFSSEKPQDPVWVRAQTILPEQFNVSWQGIPESVVFSEGTLTVASVIRPRAEVREGPGVHFRLVENILEKTNKVIVLTPFEVWQKVIDVKSGQSGWVHHKTLSPAAPNKNPISLETDKFPIVFSVHTIKYGFEYPGRKKRYLSIPRGRGFPSLRHEKGRSLVWIQETNSVLWLNRKSLR